MINFNYYVCIIMFMRYHRFTPSVVHYSSAAVVQGLDRDMKGTLEPRLVDGYWYNEKLNKFFKSRQSVRDSEALHGQQTETIVLLLRHSEFSSIKFF